MTVFGVALLAHAFAYVIPTYLRVAQGAGFQPGPWHLGRWGVPIGIVAIAWVAFITVLFMLPQGSPITRLNFNYAPIAVLVVLGHAGVSWIVSARKWFTGPRVQGTDGELDAIERELGAV